MDFVQDNTAVNALVFPLIDLQGMLMLPQPGEVRPGYQEIRAKYFVKSKASRSQIEQIKKMAEDLSPTRDTLSSKV
jgi:hypothetical protein